MSTEVHVEEVAAGWPLSRSPLEAAHFIYVGKTAAAQ